MTDQAFLSPSPLREAVEGVSPADVLRRLPEMGRVMVIARAADTLLERIGPVASVALTNTTARLEGDCHSALIDLDALESVVIDRRSVMRDKVYPRLEFNNAAGDLVVSVVGMDGSDPFDAGLKGLPRREVAIGPVPAVDTAAETPLSPPAPADDDPAMIELEKLVTSGAAATLTLNGPGLQQHWRGQIAALRPMMGYINIITPDFHLHLKGGSVTGWRVDAPGVLSALGPDGQPTGLTLQSATQDAQA